MLKDEKDRKSYSNFINIVKQFTNDSRKNIIVYIYISYYKVILVEKNTDWKLAGDLRRAYSHHFLPIGTFALYAYMVVLLKLTVAAKKMSIQSIIK